MWNKVYKVESPLPPKSCLSLTKTVGKGVSFTMNKQLWLHLGGWALVCLAAVCAHIPALAGLSDTLNTLGMGIAVGTGVNAHIEAAKP